MGNMPNRWGGRLVALLVALLAAFLGYDAGAWAADRLTNGFTLGWYAHPAARAFPALDVVLASGLVAAGVGLVAALLVTPLVVLGTRALVSRARYQPPAVVGWRARSLSAHAGLMALLALVVGALASLVAFAMLRVPDVITRVSASGYVLMLTTGAAAAAGLVALAAAWSSFALALAGRIPRDAPHNALAHGSAFASRHPAIVITAALALTLVAGYFAPAVHADVDVNDALPRGDATTLAAENLSTQLHSSFTQHVTMMFHAVNASDTAGRTAYDQDNARFLANRRTTADPANVTDEVYVRALDQFERFAQARSAFHGTVGSADVYKLVNWTFAGGQNASNVSFSLPDPTTPGELQYASVLDQGVRNSTALSSAVDAFTSPDWTQTAVLLLVDPHADTDGTQVGQAAEELRAAYADYVKTDPNAYHVFGGANAPTFSVDAPLEDAHTTDLVSHDARVLVPIALLVLAIVFFALFRSFIAFAIALLAVGMAATWTAGAMALLHIPLDPLDLALVPLVLALAVEACIHTLHEHDELRHRSQTNLDAWTIAGGASAWALGMASLAAIAGLLLLMLSPSRALGDVGLVGAIGVASIFALAWLFVPALGTMIENVRDPSRLPQRRSTPSRVVPPIARGVSRARWVVLALLVVASLVAATTVSGLAREPLGDPTRDWLPDDPVRAENERALTGFYGDATVKANVLVFEGDLTDPTAHTYISAVTNSLLNASRQTGSRIVPDTLRDIPFAVAIWVQVKDGVNGQARLLGGSALGPILAPAAGPNPTQAPTYPTTREGVQDAFNGMHASPLHAFQDLLLSHPDDRLGVTVFSVRVANADDSRAAWAEVQQALAAADGAKPAGMQVHVAGSLAHTELYSSDQLPWIDQYAKWLALATLVVVLLIALADWRAGLLVALVSAASVALWAGALRLAGIGISLGLALPLLFALALAGRHALVLARTQRRTRGDPEGARAAYAAAGKGVLFGSVATLGAFIVFTRVSTQSGRAMMLATVLAIAVTLVVTLLAAPIVYPVARRSEA